MINTMQEIECDFCGEEFKKAEHLEDHINSSHPTSSKETPEAYPVSLENEKNIKDKEQNKNDKEIKVKEENTEQVLNIVPKPVEIEPTPRHINIKLKKLTVDGIVENFAAVIKDEDENTKAMAIAMLKKTNPDLVKAKDRAQITLDDMKFIMKESGMSKNKLFAILAVLRKKWGHKIVEPNTVRNLKELKYSPGVMFDQRNSSYSPNNPNRKPKTGKEKNCEICNRELANGWVLRRHMRRCVNYPRTAEELDNWKPAKKRRTRKPGDLTCHLCGENFNEKGQLKIHMLGHEID